MCLIAFIGGRERTRVWETVGRFPPPSPKNVKGGRDQTLQRRQEKQSTGKVYGCRRLTALSSLYNFLYTFPYQ